MLTEGTYPFYPGGVSTWADMLCRELENEINFAIVAITGSPHVNQIYKVGNNVQQLIHVPLWGALEPSRYYAPDAPFSVEFRKKSRVNEATIRKYFLPLFDDFMEMLFDPFNDVRLHGQIIYGLWKYFRCYSYKETLSSRLVWELFKTKLLALYAPYLQFSAKEYARSFRSRDLKTDKATIYGLKDIVLDMPMQKPSVFNLVFNLRWLYHFLLPLSIPIPKNDVTHTTLAGIVGLSSIVARYEYGNPMLVTDHGVFIRERLINISLSRFSYFSKKLLVDLATFITRSTYYLADQISPVTHFNKKWEIYFEANNDKIDVIPNGIDTDRFAPVNKDPQKKRRPTVVAAARVYPLKDIKTMIRSCAVAKEVIPDIRYIVYGSLNADRHYVSECLRLISELKLTDNFKFAGVNTNPPEIFNEGDVSILTSISEGFPYTVIESMSCECPVVATDVGGVSEALEDSGLVCKPRDYKALGMAVVRLLLDDGLRWKMGKKGRKRVLKNYTKEKAVKRYLESYIRLSQSERRPLKHEVTIRSVKDMINHSRIYEEDGCV